MHDTNFLTVFKWVYGRLQPFRKKQFWVLYAAMFFVATVEAMTLGAIAFFASSIADPSSVLTSKYIFFIKKIVYADFLNSAKGIIIGSGAVMCFLITTKNIIKAITNFGLAKFSGTMEAYFGKILLDGFLRMPYAWHLDQNSANLINAIQWRQFLGRNFFIPCLGILNDSLMILIMLISLFIVQPTVSFTVLIVIGPSAYLIYKVIKPAIDKIAIMARDYQQIINKETTMSLQGIKDVKICGREDIFVSKYLENAIPLSKILGVQKLFVDLPVLILETIGFGILFLSICIMLLKFKITTAYITGTMALLAITAWKALPAVSQILNNISSLRNSYPYINNLMDYISVIESNACSDQQTQIKSFDFTRCIEFKQVCFSYQSIGAELFQDLNFKINKGETIGVIGTSGAGKSTLVDLLIGLLKPVKGTIIIDDKTLSNDNISSWLKIIGYVPQAPYIYDGTLAENISFGVDHKTTDRSLIRKCCTMASMDDFISNLSDGIDSRIGERGIKLSGGQQQRVAIARALYREPEIMIFDEATSSLDTKSEKAIKKTIYSLKGKQTLIIIAHRLSTVEECDKVIWLEKGKVQMIEKPEKVIEMYREYQS